MLDRIVVSFQVRFLALIISKMKRGLSDEKNNMWISDSVSDVWGSVGSGGR